MSTVLAVALVLGVFLAFAIGLGMLAVRMLERGVGLTLYLSVVLTAGIAGGAVIAVLIVAVAMSRVTA